MYHHLLFAPRGQEIYVNYFSFDSIILTVGLDECSVCPPISCEGANTKVCNAVTDGSTGCSQETCSLPLVGTCPDETICSPDCPDDFIPCYAPSELGNLLRGADAKTVRGLGISICFLTYVLFSVAHNSSMSIM